MLHSHRHFDWRFTVNSFAQRDLRGDTKRSQQFRNCIEGWVGIIGGEDTGYRLSSLVPASSELLFTNMELFGRRLNSLDKFELCGHLSISCRKLLILQALA